MLNLEKLQRPIGKYSIGFHHTSLIDDSRKVEGKGFREFAIMIWDPDSSVEGCDVKHTQLRKAFELKA